jgi:predicted esterase
MSNEPTERPGVESEIVEARTHGRYFLRRPAAGEAKLLLVGCHGYGENAERHLSELEQIRGAGDFALLAIEALNAFYERRSNQVVRGWMTRDLRERAIEDNLAYLRSVLDRVRPKVGWSVPLAFLGFSQGTAMAWRAAVRGGHDASAIVALGGDLPPELAALPLDRPFPPRVLLAAGEWDEWYTAEKLAADEAALAGRPVAVERFVYPGGHEWTDAVRARIGLFLAGLPSST